MMLKTVVLRCSPARAFVLFTEHATAWWPPQRRHTADCASDIRFESSGRFYERASDGTEVELGVVRIFEPAIRLVLDWYPGTGPAEPTRVDVHFEAVDAGTRITIRHAPGAANHATFDRNAAGYARSWDLVLAALAAAAAAALDV